MPHLGGVVLERITVVDGVVEIAARARGSCASCPGCGESSSRVHSRYWRSLADAAVGGQPVRIRLQVRRFACASTACARKTFVEQVQDLTVRYGRRSQLLHRLLEAIGLTIGGRPGARLAGRFSVPVSRMTLLRMVRALPEPAPGEVTEVGIDDFALRRGHVYGTIVIDINSHRPLDVLPDRTADTVAAWLTKYPAIRVICRDRAGAYAEGARVGAPNAMQVADRWHLWHNLAQAVEKTVVAHRAELRRAPDVGDDAPTMAKAQSTVAVADTHPVDGRLIVRTRERYAAVRQLRDQGRSITAISRELGLNRHTARRFADAGDIEELLVKARSRESLLDAVKPYLHERFNTGHTDAAALTEQIKAFGYRGSDQTVRRYLHPFRTGLTAPPPTPIAPSVRQVTGWLTRHPDSVPEDERLELKKVLDRSDVLTTTHRQVHEFAQMLTERRGERLSDWMQDVETNGSLELRSFVTGLRHDLDAVTV